jgi:hypothetical protein
VNKHWPEDDDEADTSSETEETDDETEESEENAGDEFLDQNGRWRIGVELEAKWIDSEFYHGEVSRIFKNGNYSFRFRDGSDDFLKSVPHDEIRLRTPVVPFGEPDVEVSSASEEEVEEIEEELEIGSKAFYVQALKDFLESQLDNHEYFVHATRTNNTESFHNVCNKYYHKGLSCSFAQYKMKKTFAAMDWNEPKLDMRTDAPVASWKQNVLKEFLRRKAAKRGEKSTTKAGR